MAQRHTEGLPNREAALEELMLLWLANINPAFKPFRELFDDKNLKQQTIYPNRHRRAARSTSHRPAVFSRSRQPLSTLCARPCSPRPTRSPASWTSSASTGQISRRRPAAASCWPSTSCAKKTSPSGCASIPRPRPFATARPTWGGEGFVGDEYIGFDENTSSARRQTRRRRYATDYQAPLHEYEPSAPTRPGCPTSS
jgi:hypothetical protein